MLACVHELWCFYTQDDVQFIFPENTQKRTTPSSLIFFLCFLVTFKCHFLLLNADVVYWAFAFFFFVSFISGAVLWRNVADATESCDMWDLFCCRKTFSDCQLLFLKLDFQYLKPIAGITATGILLTGREILHKYLRSSFHKIWYTCFFFLFFLCLCIPVSFVISLGGLFYVKICLIVLNLCKNMLIKEACLLLAGVIDFSNSYVAVAFRVQ